MTFFVIFRSHPIIYFPSFYMFKGMMDNQSIVSSLQQCYTDMPVNLRALWMVWVPAQLINFSLVPMHLRIPYGEIKIIRIS